jgi:uncharacterized phage protein gp47/JayE
MTLGFPSSVNVILERMKSDSQSIVPSLNPGLRDSFHRSLLTAFAGGSFEQFTQLDLLKDELFIGTATGEFLERWGSYKSITRNAASQAQGFITISGINGTFVGLGTTFSSDEGVQYSTLSNVTVTSQSINVTSIIRVGNIATVTTPSDHLLASGIEVTIAGANETDYNGTYPITVISSTEFTYTISTTPSTPATGTITAGFTTASVEVQSLTTGSNTNQGSGIALVVDTPIAGLNDTGYVQFGQLGGGTEIESDENLRVRILEAYQNPISFFNTAQITAQAKLVPGVTRVFVKPTAPDVGQVTIYFTRDNDTNIIPSLSEVTAVKNKILEIKPDFIAEADIIVSHAKHTSNAASN